MAFLAWHGDCGPALPLPVGSGQVFHRDHPARTGLVTSQPVGLALVLVTCEHRTPARASGSTPGGVIAPVLEHLYGLHADGDGLGCDA